MSLPTHGQLSASAPGLKLSFDGRTWTGEGRGFDLVKPDLDNETRYHAGQHITLDIVAKSVLEAVFPGAWKIESFEIPAWKTELPVGAVD
jgi:hypothetical protein